MILCKCDILVKLLANIFVDVDFVDWVQCIRKSGKFLSSDFHF